jgi:hypothetical protein
MGRSFDIKEDKRTINGLGMKILGSRVDFKCYSDR